MVVGDAIGTWRVACVAEPSPRATRASLARGVDRAGLQVLHTPEPGDRERVRQAALSLLTLAHPNVLRVLEVTQVDGDVALVVEPAPRASLVRWIQTAPHDLGETLRVFRGLIAGLQAIHDISVVHRAVEPARVRLGRSPLGRITAKLDDVLVGQVSLGETSGDGGPTTLARYSPPEAFDPASASGPRGDLFSAGCVLYEMLTSRPAFDSAERIAIYEAMVRARYVPAVRHRPDLPEVVSELLDDLLQPDVSTRVQSAHALLDRVDSGLMARWISRATTLPVDPTDVPALAWLSADSDLTDDNPALPAAEGPQQPDGPSPARPPNLSLPSALLEELSRVATGETPESAPAKIRPFTSVAAPSDLDPWDPLSEDAPRAPEPKAASALGAASELEAAAALEAAVAPTVVAADVPDLPDLPEPSAVVRPKARSTSGSSSGARRRKAGLSRAVLMTWAVLFTACAIAGVLAFVVVLLVLFT